MKAMQRITAVSIAAFVLLLAACASSGPRITSQADPQADFGTYRTFAFYAPLALESGGYATPTSERIKAATRAQMESRGYVYRADQPDVLVNINGNLQERTDVSTVPSMDYARYYGYRGRGMYAVPVWTEQTRVSQYTEGTLNIDLVDRAQNRLVWEGIAVGRVNKNVKPEERAVRIDAAVADIFAKFPYRAGSSTPVATP
jgi:Domain of unknown function (DUF4136)